MNKENINALKAIIDILLGFVLMMFGALCALVGVMLINADNLEPAPMAFGSMAICVFLGNEILTKVIGE